jgi:hypothetical protein
MKLLHLLFHQFVHALIRLSRPACQGFLMIRLLARLLAPARRPGTPR